MYSGKKGSIRAKRLYLAKMVVFGQSDVFGQGGCIRAKLLYSGKCGCIRGKLLYSGKVAVFGQSDCIRENLVVFETKWCYF